MRFERVWINGGWRNDVGDGPPVRGWTLPGLTSLHSHAFQRGMAGLAERRGGGEDSFWTWRETMYAFLDRLTPDDVAAIAAQAYVEMLERGFTHVVEFHYLHHDVDGRPYANRVAMAEAIAHAAAITGMGLTLLPTLYRYGGFGSVAPTHGQRRFISSPDAFARLVDDSVRAVSNVAGVQVGVALHSLRAVAPDDIAFAAGLRATAPLHIHIAEQEKEVADCLAWSGARPVQWLLDNAAVDARWCLVHATHMTEMETVALARTGAVAGLCPVTEANLGDGIFPGTGFRAAGGRFGVGTDSNVLISAGEELRTLEYGQRLRDRRRVRLADSGASNGAALLDAVLAGGCQAAGLSNSDAWIVLDADHASLAGAHAATVIDRAIFAAPSLPVREVWRDGCRLVADGRHGAHAVVAAKFASVMSALTAQL